MLSADSTKDDRTIAWETALNMRMNVIYYQRAIGRLKRVDTVARVASAVASSAAVVVLVADKLPTLAPWLAGVAALITVGSGALRVPERVRALGVLLVEYVGHRHTFERLYQQFSRGEDAGKGLERALAKLAETEQREANDDPPPPRRLLERAQRETLEAIGAPAN